MVLMSLVKSPIAQSFLVSGTRQRGPFIAGTPICSIADTR
jgi:hypothetical protein